MTTEKTLPVNADAERAVLGSILLDPSGWAYHQAVSRLQPGQFALHSHRCIFSRMVELMEAGKPIDFNTLTEQLGQNREIESVGGVAYVTSLTDGLPRVKNISAHVDIIVEKASLRNLIHAANGACEAAYEQMTPPSHILGILQDQILSMMANGNKGGAVKVSDFSDETLNILMDRRKSSHRLVGFSTGLDSLDFATTGIRRKEFWTIGGRAGDGKTSLALQIAAANASQGLPVAYFSLEMDRNSLLERLWSSAGRIDYKHIRVPSLLDDHGAMRLAQTKMAVDDWPLFIEDSDSYAVSEIAARSRLLIKQHKVGLIIVDYLQIVDAPGRDERQRLTKISKAIRMLAKSEDVAVVGLSQMPRPRDSDMNKRPTKFDLKESGSLENDSHTVLMIFRPVDELNQYRGEDEIVIAKQRSGETGIEPVIYLGRNMKFEPRAL